MANLHRDLVRRGLGEIAARIAAARLEVERVGTGRQPGDRIAPVLARGTLTREQRGGGTLLALGQDADVAELGSVTATAPDGAGDDAADPELAVDSGELALLGRVQDRCLAVAGDVLPPLRRVVGVAAAPVGEDDPDLARSQEPSRETVAPVMRGPDSDPGAVVGGAANHPGADPGERTAGRRADHARYVWAVAAPGIRCCQPVKLGPGCTDDGHRAGRRQGDRPQDGGTAWCDEHRGGPGWRRRAAVVLAEVAVGLAAVAVPERVAAGAQAGKYVPAAGRGRRGAAAGWPGGDDAGPGQALLTGAAYQAGQRAGFTDQGRAGQGSSGPSGR